MNPRPAHLDLPDISDPTAQPAKPIGFGSILFADQQARDEGTPQPDYFRDLALDQIVASVTEGQGQYALTPIYRQTLRSAEDVAYRQAIVGELERSDPLRAAVKAFVGSMQRMRDALAQAQKHRHFLQKQARLLEAACAYCDGVHRFAGDLDAIRPSSNGLRLWQSYLEDYAQSERFREMRRHARKLATSLSEIRFTTTITGLHVRIDPFEGKPDYGAQITESYTRFAQGGTEKFAFMRQDGGDLNMIEERIVEQVARAFPEPFAALAAFVIDHGLAFQDPVAVRFDREVQFYMAYLAHVAPLREAGLPFCLPEIVDSKDVFAQDSFDLALAHKLTGSGAQIVPNDFKLEGHQRILIVSGPNQGGKTTFARMFGQLHHLGCLGLPVPGKAARLHLFDRIFTHFERREVATSPHGKLQDELVRMHAIVGSATGDSIVIMNELFASTTFRDAELLSEKITAELVGLDLLCVWVSFLDRLSDMSETMVSMVSGVDPDDLARRTYRIERRKADGMAYARAIASKYGLTRQQIEQRLQR